MRVGAGKSVIPLKKELFPIEQYESVLDNLHTRAVLICSTVDILLVSLELTSLQPYAIEMLKKAAAKVCHVPEKQIFISVTHTFSAPHTRSQEALKMSNSAVYHKNQQFLEALVWGVEEACKQTLVKLEEVTVYTGLGQARINVNRDIETPAGYWLGQNQAGFSCLDLPILSFKNQKGQVIALIYSYDVQSSLIEHYDRKLISSDLVGKVSQLLEGEFQQAVAVYLLGCAADQVPKGKRSDQDTCNQLAELLCKAVCETSLEELPDTELSMFSLHLRVAGQVLPDMRSLKPSKTYTYLADKDRQVEVEFLWLGGFVLAMLRPELASITGAEIRRHSPYTVTMIATMVNGGQKYMVNKEAYANMSYEAMNSMFAKGAAEAVSQAIIDRLNKSYQK